MTQRPRQEWGTIPWDPATYGQSHLGVPLEVWRPSGVCTLLVFAGIHGEEPETTFALAGREPGRIATRHTGQRVRRRPEPQLPHQ